MKEMIAVLKGIRKEAIVKADGSIEVIATGLPAGTSVEVTVLLKERAEHPETTNDEELENKWADFYSSVVGVWKDDEDINRVFNQKRDDCALPIVVVAELYKGAYCSRRVKDNLNVLSKFLRRLPTAEFNIDTAKEFGLIQAELRMIGRPTNEMDALIAAISRSHAATLVTHNTKDFDSIPGLKLEDWLM